jgi:hypothetical protein
MNSMSDRDRCLAAALEYLARGWSVLPLWWPTRYGCACRGGIDCPTPGKHPCLPRWRHLQYEPPSADDLDAWWMAWPHANVGVVTGSISRLAVVDVDPRSGGDETSTSSTSSGSGCRRPRDSSKPAVKGYITT